MKCFTGEPAENRRRFHRRTGIQPLPSYPAYIRRDRGASSSTKSTPPLPYGHNPGTGRQDTLAPARSAGVCVSARCRHHNLLSRKVDNVQKWGSYGIQLLLSCKTIKGDVAMK